MEQVCLGVDKALEEGEKSDSKIIGTEDPSGNSASGSNGFCMYSQWVVCVLCVYFLYIDKKWTYKVL